MVTHSRRGLDEKMRRCRTTDAAEPLEPLNVNEYMKRMRMRMRMHDNNEWSSRPPSEQLTGRTTEGRDHDHDGD